MKPELEYKMTIPHIIRVQSKNKKEYKTWIVLYFKSVHPNLQVKRIEKGFAILVKRQADE